MWLTLSRAGPPAAASLHRGPLPTLDTIKIARDTSSVTTTLATEDYQAKLRIAGLRVTAPRLAVLLALESTGPHQDVEGITAAARARLGTLSTQAVYDNLATLVAAGLVRRIQPSGGPARFEARVGDNHHHVVCRRCGSTADVDCAVGDAPCLDPSDAAGFFVDEAEVIYWGLCPACLVTNSDSSGALDRAPSARHRPAATDPGTKLAGARTTNRKNATPGEEKDRSG